MTSTRTAAPTVLPSLPGPAVRITAVASLAAQILIVATGAAVRLTGSGLGCPTWPRCTAESFTTTPAMGAHGLIEFGNRLLTFALVVVAVAAFAAAWRGRRGRRDLFALAVVQLASIPAQAVLGGITVWTGLNPWVVAAHFVFSLALVAAMTVFVHRTRVAPGPRTLAVPPIVTGLAGGAAAAAVVVLLLGIITTGSGPHAGDADAPRNGLDPSALVQVHETAAWVLFVLTMALVVITAARRLSAMRAAQLLLTVEALQIVVGITQVMLNWSAGVVVVHVLLAACLTAATTNLVLALRRPARLGSADAAAREAAPA